MYFETRLSVSENQLLNFQDVFLNEAGRVPLVCCFSLKLSEDLSGWLQAATTSSPQACSRLPFRSCRDRLET